MKILQIHPIMKTLNGSERIVIELTRELVGRGHDTQILSLRIAEECRREIDRDARTSELRLPVGRDGYFASFLQYLMMPLLLIKAEKADFIIGHACASLPAAVIWSKLSGTASIYLCHEPPRFAYDLNELHGARLRSGRMLLSLASALMRRLDRYLVSKVDRVVVLSEYMRDSVQAIYAVDPVVIPGGVEVDRFAGKDRGSSPLNRPMILSVGKLHPRKNYEMQLHALRDLNQGDRSRRLVIVGEGPQRRELEDLAEELSISGFVHFAGYVDEEDLPAYYHEADVFVFTAYNEPFGLVVLEAMGCGLPVVVPGEGGPAEIVVDQESGYHFQPGNLDDLEDKLGRCLSLSGDERQVLGERARERASRYSWKEYADRIEDLLHHTDPGQR